MTTATDRNRYLLSPTGLLHLRAAGGVVEDDGLSTTDARCGWEAAVHDARPLHITPGARICRRCERIAP